jgi:ABC-type lipopolysaccharide export system ATPase subunit
MGFWLTLPLALCWGARAPGGPGWEWLLAALATSGGAAAVSVAGRGEVRVEERAVLEVQGIGKAYRMRPVLRDVGFAVRTGECVALLGSNGAGKSTLLGCLTATASPTGHGARLRRRPVLGPRAAAGCMGVVPERPFLYEELTVAELLRFVAAARNLPESEAAAEADRLWGCWDCAARRSCSAASCRREWGARRR